MVREGPITELGFHPGHNEEPSEGFKLRDDTHVLHWQQEKGLGLEKWRQDWPSTLLLALLPTSL